MAQHSRSRIIPTADLPGSLELMRLSDDTYKQLLNSLVNAKPAAAVPGLSAEVEQCIQRLVANPEDLIVTILSLYVLHKRAQRNESDAGSELAAKLRLQVSDALTAPESDWNRLTDRIRTLLLLDNTTRVSDTDQNTDLPSLGKNHPIAHLAGRYKDDPAFEKYLEELEKYRRQVTEHDLAELALAEST